MSVRARKLSQVPVSLLVALIILGMVQVLYHHLFQRGVQAVYQPLSEPMPAEYYRAMSFGSDQLLSYAQLLRLQLHDNQKGQHVSYQRLDYDNLSKWLLTLSELNPHTDYPAFLAMRVYSQVKDEVKIRKLIEVTQQLFLLSPQLNWRRLSEACLLAKHQLKDLPLALTLAEQLAETPSSVNMPHWARDMRLILLDELNQLESAQILISSMLHSGDIKDNDEIRFLQQRLLKIQQQLLVSERKGQN